MGEKQISLHINEEFITECAQKGWHYKEVFIAGMDKLRGMPNLLNRMNELEAGNAKLSRAYAQLWTDTHTEKGV